MGEMGLLPIVLATLAFFIFGALWYGPLFSKVWQREAGLSEEAIRGGNMAMIFGLAFLFEMLVVTTLAHTVARTGASDRATMMMAVGFGATIMVPAIGINYLFQRRSAKLFAIDAGHFIIGMAIVGAVLIAWR
ncbi:DUF1761 domain-containing protein [Alteriqipengyuania flavescens]|uniref:DUF1761 domain-containing protein n=1 Tax=Alteriqipengyuania flavescens TaxID=3053610 RepID=UPI0025B42FA8|nr:DUF1761 domain-containing protein [Alteriqipengyuania flavescens]WJY17582.1 DUF1761 domain-containing protein [Alteriqipengyuania flavescens]WJY23525.1 DUF1761 domain-containing protein [Alteriqipengyuania flavescens]